jgi:hypothetical protein
MFITWNKLGDQDFQTVSGLSRTFRANSNIPVKQAPLSPFFPTDVQVELAG